MVNNEISIKKIAFIKMGSFSHTNESVINVLKKEFPNNPIEIIDIWEEVVKFKSIINTFHAFKEYGPKMFLSKKNLVKSLVYNVDIFKKVKQGINNRLRGGNYLFTFQTQSIFDTSVEGIPNYMYTDHTVIANEKYPGFNEGNTAYSNEWIMCERSIYQNATLNFTMSKNIQKSIIHDYDCPEEKVKCVYAGSNVNIDNMKDLSADRYRSKNILFVGLDWERKGGPTLLSAFKKILENHHDSTLTIVGCSPKLDVENCTIAGKVPLSAVQQYYKRASIFCLPTTLEPFGIAFLEAMNNRLPIVATNIGAIPDFIVDDRNGYQIQPGDSEALAEKLSVLLKSPEKCEQFGKYGFDNILGKYTWDNVGIKIKKYISVSLKNGSIHNTKAAVE